MSSDLLLGPADLARTIRRLAHEIVEHTEDLSDLVLLGILSRGRPLAERIGKAIATFEGRAVPIGWLDIGPYRDDVTLRSPHLKPSHVTVDLTGRTVVLVDDVLFTGRSVRAALDALNDFGRPARVRLVVIVDRGHRELPIRPDFVGKNIPTGLAQDVQVRLEETDGVDGVYIETRQEVVNA